jgi:hypothetical protein
VIVQVPHLHSGVTHVLCDLIGGIHTINEVDIDAEMFLIAIGSLGLLPHSHFPPYHIQLTYHSSSDHIHVRHSVCEDILVQCTWKFVKNPVDLFQIQETVIL